MAMGLVSALKRSILGVRVAQPAEPPAEVPTQLYKLSRILLAHGRKGTADKPASVYDVDAWCAEDPKAVKLFIQEIGLSKLVFHTPALLQKGEVLELEILLQGLGNWKGQARVDWCLTSTAGFIGQVTLDNDPTQFDLWRTFVSRQSQGMRG